MMTCQRCKKECGSHTMSMFNFEWICRQCHLRERRHPKYAEAVKAEQDAIDRGEGNIFPGIGCPSDLYKPLEGH
jgi:hypothetical protein